MDCAAEFVGVAEASEGCLADYGFASGCEGAVGVGEEGAVLVGYEEAGGYGVDADAGGEFFGYFGCEECCEVGDSGFGGGVACYAGDGAEGCHG